MTRVFEPQSRVGYKLLGIRVNLSQKRECGSNRGCHARYRNRRTCNCAEHEFHKTKKNYQNYRSDKISKECTPCQRVQSGRASGALFALSSCPGYYFFVYLDIRTIVGLLAYRRLSTKPSYHPSPSPRILSIASISSAPSDMSRLEPSTRSSLMWKALAGGTKSWILSHQGEVDATFGGVVLIVMYTRNHMTVDTRIPTNPGQSRSGFH